MTPTTFEALALRAESGEWGGKFDGDIELTLNPALAKKPWRRDTRRGCEGRFWDDSDPDGGHYEDALRYSTSLDAHKGMGAWVYAMEHGTDRAAGGCIAFAMLDNPPTGLNPAYVGLAPTECAARLAAILRALGEKG